MSMTSRGPSDGHGRRPSRHSSFRTAKEILQIRSSLGKLRGSPRRRKKSFFYATNDDDFDIVAGYAMPATGVLLKPIEALARPTRKDEMPPFGAQATVLGKPNPEFISKVIEWNALDRKKCCFVGDRLDTDILMGNRAQIGTIFVLSGVHEERDIERLEIQPSYMLKSLAELYPGEVPLSPSGSVQGGNKTVVGSESGGGLVAAKTVVATGERQAKL